MLPGMFTVAVTFIFASLSYTLSIFFAKASSFGPWCRTILLNPSNLSSLVPFDRGTTRSSHRTVLLHVGRSCVWPAPTLDLRDKLRSSISLDASRIVSDRSLHIH
jgi:hypothetical protein